MSPKQCLALNVRQHLPLPNSDKATSNVEPQHNLTMGSAPESSCFSSLSTLVKWSSLLHELLLMQNLQQSPDGTVTSICRWEHDSFVKEANNICNQTLRSTNQNGGCLNTMFKLAVAIQNVLAFLLDTKANREN